MADFCKQCSEDMFDKDFGDMQGMSNEDHTLIGLFATALCEGCGPIQVNHLGECVSKDCTKKHGE